MSTLPYTFVANEVLIEDLQNTIREKRAYTLLISGYVQLVVLPEARLGGKDVEYRAQMKHYVELKKSCIRLERELRNALVMRGFSVNAEVVDG